MECHGSQTQLCYSSFNFFLHSCRLWWATAGMLQWWSLTVGHIHQSGLSGVVHERWNKTRFTHFCEGNEGTIAKDKNGSDEQKHSPIHSSNKWQYACYMMMVGALPLSELSLSCHSLSLFDCTQSLVANVEISHASERVSKFPRTPWICS